MSDPSDTRPHLVLGVTGGIAAYKAADLVSQAVKAGFEVRVVMTPSATAFIGPTTLQALSGHPVMTSPLQLSDHAPEHSNIEHIEWAKWADVVCVAPLTASSLAKIACGMADDALGTLLLAIPSGVPCLLCPAMNTAMWEHPAVVRNLRWLADLNRYDVVAPVAKRLACGDVGVGGLEEVPAILAAIERAIGR